MNRPETFAQNCINSDTDECLDYPMAKDMDGYGLGQIDGKVQRVHRYVCKAVHGEPPQDKPQSGHSCGRPPCCNPKHLRWVDAKENAQDRYEHGRTASKLTKENVLFIKVLLRKRISQNEIAVSFGVSKGTISRIKSGHLWKHV